VDVQRSVAVIPHIAEVKKSEESSFSNLIPVYADLLNPELPLAAENMGLRKTRKTACFMPCCGVFSFSIS